MKGWDVIQPYWKRKHRLMHQLRLYHYNQVKDSNACATIVDKKLTIIANLSKRIP